MPNTTLKEKYNKLARIEVAGTGENEGFIVYFWDETKSLWTIMPNSEKVDKLIKYLDTIFSTPEKSLIR